MIPFHVQKSLSFSWNKPIIVTVMRLCFAVAIHVKSLLSSVEGHCVSRQMAEVPCIKLPVVSVTFSGNAGCLWKGLWPHCAQAFWGRPIPFYSKGTVAETGAFPIDFALKCSWTERTHIASSETQPGTRKTIAVVATCVSMLIL